MQWDDRSQPLTIAEKELIPIVLGCTARGQSWSGHRVECFCDNQVVISCIRLQTSWQKGLMHLLRCPVYVEARFSFAIVPLYINMKANVLADELSRDPFSLEGTRGRYQPNTSLGPAAGPSPRATSRLDQSDLPPSVQGYFQRGLAASTQSTYRAALRRFHTFCIKYDIATPFPVTEQLLCYFSAYLVDQGLSPQTGRSYLAAVRSMQVSLGLPYPRDQSSMPLLKRVQAGIRRVRVERGTQQARVRLPITLEVLGKVQRHLKSSQHPHQQLLWAISTLAIFGFFRAAT